MSIFQFISGIFCLFCYVLTIYLINKRIDRINDKIAELDSKILRMRCDLGILSDNQNSTFDELVRIINKNEVFNDEE